MRNVGWQGAEPLQIWTISDGRAGIEAQALGLAEAILRRTPGKISKRRVMLRTPWRWLPPGMVVLPRQALTDNADAIDPPWPDLAITCGRQAVPFAMGLKGWSRGKTLVVTLQDPRINPRELDLVVPPSHDGLEGPNVVPTLGACHRITPARIAEEAAHFPRDLAGLAGPKVAVLIGGKSKRQNIGAARAMDIASDLLTLHGVEGAQLLVTLSRRTGTAARTVLRERVKPKAALFYDPADPASGPNPYFALLHAADHILVTADSVNMAAEAAATGKPVQLLAVDGAAGKLGAFHGDLVGAGHARWFSGALEHWPCPPLLEADRIAGVVLERLRAA